MIVAFRGRQQPVELIAQVAAEMVIGSPERFVTLTCQSSLACSRVVLGIPDQGFQIEKYNGRIFPRGRFSKIQGLDLVTIVREISLDGFEYLGTLE